VTNLTDREQALVGLVVFLAVLLWTVFITRGP